MIFVQWVNLCYSSVDSRNINYLSFSSRQQRCLIMIFSTKLPSLDVLWVWVSSDRVSYYVHEMHTDDEQIFLIQIFVYCDRILCEI
jgi:hypothetical protein